MLRAIGNSKIPLLFLAVASLTNIILDIYFIVSLHLGVAGAAIATSIAQALSAIRHYDICCHKRKEFNSFNQRLLF